MENKNKLNDINGQTWSDYEGIEMYFPSANGANRGTAHTKLLADAVLPRARAHEASTQKFFF